MSRSNRDDFAEAFRLAIYLLTAVGFLVVVWQISGTYAERRQNAEHRAHQYADTTDRRIANACATVERSAVLECVTKQVESAREDERTEYDLQAQQDSANAAFWMAWISFATLTATLVALWFVKGTLDATREAVKDTSEATDAMRKANELAEDTARRQLRAYVGIESISVFDVTMGMKPTAHIVVRNFGQTPVDKFDVISYMAFGPVGMEVELTVDENPRLEYSTLPPNVARKGYPKLAAVITPDIFALFDSGAARIYVFGEARYEDAFGIPRTTYFRAYYDRSCLPGATHNCASGNHAT